MKNVHVVFEDLEYMKLVEQKGKNLSWREFIIELSQKRINSRRKK